MKHLFAHLKAYRKECILGPLFKLIEATLELLIPLIVAGMIDRGVSAGDRGYIVRMGLLMAGLGLAGLFWSVTAQYFAAKAAVGTAERLRRALFSHIQNFSYTMLDAVGGSTMLTRLTSDVNQVQSGINMTLRLALRSPFVVFGAMIVAFTIDAQSALVFAAAIAVLFAVVFAVMLVSVPLYRKVQGHLEVVLRKIRENLSGVRVLRAFSREEEEICEFSAENDRMLHAQIIVGRISALLNPITYVVINLGIVALVQVGALRVSAGALTQGDVIALYSLMLQILVELIKMANLILLITKATASCGRIAAVLDIPTGKNEVQTAPQTDETAPAVEFDGVSLRYEGAGGEALRQVSFCAERGQTIGVIGGTGSGKTSLVNLIAHFYDATSGSVRVFGADVRSYPDALLRGKIGLVPQNAVLFQGTIRENLLWGDPQADEACLLDALKTAQAAQFVAQKEGGLDFAVEQGGRNLSGGQRQRLTIARALVRRPEILILDDSTSALDFVTDAALRRALRELSWNPTVFVVSQRTASVRHADQILVMENGQLVDSGTHEALLQRCEAYREIHQSQNREVE